MKPIKADDIRVGMVVTVLRNNPYKSWEQSVPNENNPLGIGVVQVAREDNSFVGKIYSVVDVSLPFVVLELICDTYGYREDRRTSVTVHGRQWAHINESYAKALLPKYNWEGMDLYKGQIVDND